MLQFVTLLCKHPYSVDSKFFIPHPLGPNEGFSAQHTKYKQKQLFQQQNIHCVDFSPYEDILYLKNMFEHLSRINVHFTQKLT